jgi:type IX secretion system PorP/SprF family membrane protein
MLRYFLFSFFVIIAASVQAQDPQYSQYYANALWLSPSFAGADYGTRGIVAARYQWPGLDASYISNTISADHYFSGIRSGAGLIIHNDFINPSRIRTTEVGGIYSYQVDVNKKINLRPGIQMSYVNRRIDMSDLTFGSQYTDAGYIGGSTREGSKFLSVSYVDISAGGLLVTDRLWFGVALHHLNRPDQSFLVGESQLPVKASYFGGYKFMLSPEWKRRYVKPDEEISVTPTFMYKLQGKSDQLDLGLYFRYNLIVTGIWYRSLPVKIYKPDPINNDGLIFMLGLHIRDFKVGYSFDATTSRLTMQSAGSHELTLSYKVKSKKRKEIQKRPVCPEF